MISTKKYGITAIAIFLLFAGFSAPAWQRLMNFSVFAMPICWVSLFLLVQFGLPQLGTYGKLVHRGTMQSCAVLGALMKLALCFLLAAFLKELAPSPYDHTPLGVLYNLLALLPLLAARETVRAYGLGLAIYLPRWRVPLMVFTTLLLTATQWNWAKLTGSGKSLFIAVCSETLPVLAENLAAGVLVWYGGPTTSMLYLGILQVFERLFPVLPNLGWLAKSAIGICYPVFFAQILKARYEVLNHEVLPDREENFGSYIASISAAVLFCWFCVGVFRYYPSVVLTGSMEPLIQPGDAVVIRKLKTEAELEQLREGDIINFKREDITITHRILTIKKDEAGNLSFVTKGDNNDSPDQQEVAPNDIQGTVEKIVPKVGLPVLLLKSQEEIPEGVVQNGAK